VRSTEMDDIKEKEADAKRIADLEYVLSIQVGLHISEVAGLEKNLDEQSKHEISDIKRKLKNSFASVGAFSAHPDWQGRFFFIGILYFGSHITLSYVSKIFIYWHQYKN
ncbi:hypothetical protein ACJX0J_027668, partial [Zea mays]